MKDASTEDIERKLADEGLAVLEKTYRRSGPNGVHRYTKVDRQRLSVGFSDFFNKAAEFYENHLTVWSEIWRLFVFERKTYRQIGESLGIPKATVQTRVRAYTDLMRKALSSKADSLSVEGREVSDELDRAQGILEVFADGARTNESTRKETKDE